MADSLSADGEGEAWSMKIRETENKACYLVTPTKRVAELESNRGFPGVEQRSRVLAITSQHYCLWGVYLFVFKNCVTGSWFIWFSFVSFRLFGYLSQSRWLWPGMESGRSLWPTPPLHVATTWPTGNRISRPCTLTSIFWSSSPDLCSTPLPSGSSADTSGTASNIRTSLQKSC